MKVQLLERDVVWRELDGEVVILNLTTGHYYGLEGAANEIWRLLLEHGTTERVVEIMARDYDIDVGRLRQDVEAVVRDLAERSILQVDPAPDA
jgi:hypothetical protein